MLFIGIAVIIVSLFLMVAGKTASHHGDIRGASASLFGKVGIPVGVALIIGSAVRIIGPGEVGVQDLFGSVKDRELQSGVNLVNPLVNVHTFSIKTREMQETMNVPSQEGLQVDLDMSILYRIQPDQASEIFRTIGINFEDIILRPSFRSAARNVSTRFNASDLYTESRERITIDIMENLQEILSERGIEIEQVLMRSIILPNTVTQAIEDKLKADQEAQKMTFLLERERLEAERKTLEAGGIRDANRIIAEGLTASYIQWYRIEMLKQLVNSPNNTIIIIPDDMDGMPMIMNTK